MPLYREAMREDLPSICRLGEDVNALHHAAWPRIFAEAGDPMRHAAQWEQSIGAERSTAFVAEHEGQVIGFVTVFIAQDPNPLLQPTQYGRVGSIGVAPQCWGQGVGTGLMQLAEQWARQRGALDIRLHVWAFNERALRLYAELGYEVRSHVLGKQLQGADA